MSITTPRFTRAMIQMARQPFAIYTFGRLLNVVFPFAVIVIERELFNAYGLYTSTQTYWGVLLVYVAIIAARIGALYSEAWGDVTFRYRIKGVLQHNTLHQALQRPGAQPLPVSALEAINRLRDDVDEVADFPLWIPEVISTSSVAIGAFLIMAQLDLQLSLISVLPLFALGGAAYAIWPHYLKFRYQAGEREDEYTSLLGSLIAGATTLRMCAQADDALAHVQRISDQRRRINVWAIALFQAQHFLVDAGVAICGALIYWYAGQALGQGTLGVGDVLLLASSLGIIAWMPNVIATFIGDYAQQRVSITRLTDFMPDAPMQLMRTYPWWRIQPVIHHVPARPPLQSMQLHDVSYHHDGGFGIHNVSLTITRGSLTVITGAVGSGKSTLLHLLSGLLHPQSGHISWNDDAMTQIGAPDVIAATQIPFLLSDSLRTNIMLGANVPDLTDVLAASALTHDVAQLAAGLDTIVGPRGVRLSGGQRQRVALARVLVRNAQLLVLDDMTSAVDVTTEQHLWQTLRQHGTGTLVVSSHRPGIMQHADSIVVLDAGRVVAQGTLIDLLQHSPHMQRLWAEISPPERTS